MSRAPDFIGLGAPRAGTTWLYACLFEHPALCLPIKEIHFFSQEQQWRRGYEWYESLFRRCPPAATVGEFSTTYLAAPLAPERIHARYRDARLVVSLRDPVARTYSHYRHDMASGRLEATASFRQALAERPELVEGSRYRSHLTRYLDRFRRDQLLVLIHEDSRRDPQAFVRGVYAFLGVESSFTPPSLVARINAARVPRFPRVDRALSGTSRFLRDRGLHGLWWFGRRLGLGNRVRVGNWLRAANAQPRADVLTGPTADERARLRAILADDVAWVERLAGRALPEWRDDPRPDRGGMPRAMEDPAPR
jgi:Sulfotransferase domain